MWNKRKFRLREECTLVWCPDFGCYEDKDWYTVLDTDRPKHKPCRYSKALKKVLNEIKYKDCPFN